MSTKEKSSFEDDHHLSDLSSSSDSFASSESIAADYHSVSNSSENILHNFQCYILRRNASLMRKLSLQASSATTDFDTFKRWVYQDLDKHRTQLKEAGSSLFYRNESKYDIPKYDIVITFVPNCDHRLVGDFQRALLQDYPLFIVEHRKHYFANYEENALYVSASEDFFETYMRIAVDQNDLSQQDCFPSQYYPSTSVLSSLQRQTILQSILQEWQFESDQNGLDYAFPYLSKRLSVSPDEAIVPSLIDAKVIDQIFALHQEDDLDLLKQSWVSKFLSSQPLDRVCEYFGMKIAIYFAFIGFYTKSLLFPTIFGLFLSYFPMLLLQCQAKIPEWLRCCSWIILVEQDLLNDMLLFAFTIFNMFWSTIMLQKWEVSCKYYADRWSRHLPFKITLLGVQKDVQKDVQKAGENATECTLSRMVFKYCVTFPIIGLGRRRSRVGPLHNSVTLARKS